MGMTDYELYLREVDEDAFVQCVDGTLSYIFIRIHIASVCAVLQRSLDDAITDAVITDAEAIDQIHLTMKMIQILLGYRK